MPLKAYKGNFKIKNGEWFYQKCSYHRKRKYLYVLPIKSGNTMKNDFSIALNVL